MDSFGVTFFKKGAWPGLCISAYCHNIITNITKFKGEKENKPRDITNHMVKHTNKVKIQELLSKALKKNRSASIDDDESNRRSISGIEMIHLKDVPLIQES